MVNATRGRILVVDDEVDIRESLETLLELEGYTVEMAVDAGDAWRRLEKNTYDLILLDLMMPDRSGMDLLHDIRLKDTETPVIMLTAYGSVEVAVKALKVGANDYFPKPWDNDKLIIEIGNLIARGRLEEENRHLKRALKQRYSFGNIIGKSERMLKVLDLVSTVALSRSTILLSGETGTGKEVIAKAIHANSPRSEHAFVAVNSGSLPQDLLESTLFGHVKGAFTSAYAAQKGYFEIANGGTIFFDEIGNIGPETQAKLLRVIQEREFMPLGSSEVVRVDVRIIAATNAELRKLVDDGKFREDLYYRLNVINIVLPPLRDRKSDIPLLIDYFFQKYCEENGKMLDGQNRSVLHFSPEALHLLMDHSWPGNVRELENAVERAVVLAAENVVAADVLPDHILHAGGMKIRRDEAGRLPLDASLFEKVADFERRIIMEALEAAGWSQTDAAEALRIPLSTLNQKIKRLEIPIRKRGQQSA
ncbi:MAG: sigma-54 dependent transcriptional regulator [Bryobacteraceae bacterium]|nr:sigma-54 dependent transcriptional regulator [Bryobacteraceae bacterium]